MTLSSADTGLYVYRMDGRDPVNPPEYNWKATYLSGVLVQNATNNPDLIFPLGAPPPTMSPLIVNIGGAPTPIVSSYIAQYASAPGTTNVPFQPGSNPYILNALSDPDSIAFFQSNEPGAWSLEVDVSNPRVHVSGTCLWLFDRGLHVSGTLRVQGSGAPSDMLVLVGGRQTADSEDPGAGLALLGSIYSPNVPVILVSDGNVLVEHRDLGGTWPDDNNASVVNCLSIFASRARIMGPDANYDYSSTGAKLILAHPASHPANLIIDRLVGLGYLPNTIVVRFEVSPQTLNLASRGRWVMGFLEPAPPFSARDIDLASIRLNGTVPVDAAAPTALEDHDGNGVPDLMVKFNRASAERTLSEGDGVSVDVTGMLGSQSFHGTDYVRVRGADQARGEGGPVESSCETMSKASSIDAQVSMGDPEPAQFALRGAKPNPARHELQVSFSLNDSKPATLGLFDLSGRQLEARRVEGMGPGWHTVTLAGRRDLPAGVYVIRLTQQGRSLTARVAVVR